VKKIIKTTLVILVIAVVVVAGIFYFTSQLIGSTERFGIYLLKNNEQVISDEEIVWYDKNSYEIKLTDEGAEEIKALKVPVTGSPFVIKIDGKEIYEGSFWVSFSSLSYSGIVIDTLLIQNNTISIDQGYPSSAFFEGVDPRNDPRIIDNFQKLGKLKQTFRIEINYSPKFEATALAQFQNESYTRGSVMHIIDNPAQSIRLKKGDSVVLKILDNPLNATREGYNLSYNYVFLNESGGLVDVACAQISLVDPPRFVVPEDGYYIFELGVVNVDCYFPGNSIGVWAFSVTVVPP
jgi:hypothetical protein